MVLKMSTATVAAITWLLILGGMLALALGLVISRSDVGLGWIISVLSGLAILVGIVLVWVRSRMLDPE